MSGAAMTEDPLAETLARVARVGDRFALAVDDDGDGWAGASDLLAGNRVADHLGATSEAEISWRATASRFLRAYSTALVSGTVASWTLERRVPDVHPSNVRCRLGASAGAVELALRTTGFACLPDDPAAGSATRVLAEPHLLGWLRQRLLADHLARLVRRLGAHRVVSERVLWGDVAATCAATFVYWLIPRMGRRAELERDARALLDPAGAPWHGRGSWGEVGGWLVYRRDSCCVRYRFPDVDRCVDCSLIDEPERRHRLTALLDR